MGLNMLKQIPKLMSIRKQKVPLCSLCGKIITDEIYDSYCMECEKKELKKLFKNNDFI